MASLGSSSLASLLSFGSLILAPFRRISSAESGMGRNVVKKGRGVE